MRKKKYRLQRSHGLSRLEEGVHHLIRIFMGLLARRQGLRFQGCIVTGAGVDKQASTIPRSSRHLYNPKAPVLLSIGGQIADGVLVADVISDSFTDRDNILCRARKESFAPCCFCKLLERPRVLIRIVLIKDAYGVNNCVRLLRDSQNLVQLVLAGVVTPIADHNQNLLAPIAHLQVIERRGHGIVERRHTICGYSGQGNLQLRHLVGQSTIRPIGSIRFWETTHERAGSDR
jgi:hypothetical protein